MNKFIKLFEYVLFIMFLILLFFLSSKLSIFLFIPVVCLIYFFVKKCSIKNYGLFIFILAFSIRLASICFLDVSISDDFLTMYNASRDLINGNIKFLNSFYFETFSYQLGHVLYQALLLKIINSVFFLKLVNSIITSLSVLFIYLITKKLFREDIARGVSLSYIFYLYPIYLNSVLTNQLIPGLLFLIVIYLLINKKYNYKLFIIIGIILSISNFFRTESIIIVLSIVFYILININKKNYKKYLFYSLTLIIVYFGFNLFISGILYLSPINMALKNNASSWKFYCGLNYKYNGIYNESDQDIYFSSDDKNNLLIERIKKDYSKFPVLFLKKEVILWTQTNYDIQINNNINSNLYNFILLFNQGVLNLVLIIFVIGMYPNNNKKELLLIKVILGLYYFVYMFIEISPRYAYILHILIFLIIGEGIIKIFDFINNKLLFKS